MTDNELKELVAGLAVSNAELIQRFKETDAEMKRTDVKFLETEAQMARTDASLEKIFATLGSIAKNTGSITEEYFFNALDAKPILGEMIYDTVDRNIKGNFSKLRDEFNIVMYNGDSIAIIECKTKAHENDLSKLIDKKAGNFKKLFPYYKDYKIYLGLASFCFYDELEKMAKQNGVAILKQKGELMVIEADTLKAY